VKLLTFPHLEGFDIHAIEFDEESREKWETAAAYMNSVPKQDPIEPLDIKKAFHEVESMMTDSDGTVQVEWRSIDIKEMEGCIVEEQVVAPGTEVCLTGRWNGSANGIVPDEIAKGKEAVLRKGTREEVIANLRSGIIGRVIGGVLLGIAVNVVVWLILEKFPTAG
jgi:hypothetical protein